MPFILFREMQHSFPFCGISYILFDEGVMNSISRKSGKHVCFRNLDLGLKFCIYVEPEIVHVGV